MQTETCFVFFLRLGLGAVGFDVEEDNASTDDDDDDDEGGDDDVSSPSDSSPLLFLSLDRPKNFDTRFHKNSWVVVLVVVTNGKGAILFAERCRTEVCDGLGVNP